ncbi:DUF397 domain-containing protein [Streptomyces sp. NPDC057474]|uniref:DUF397 domain-containing protein n=1 Tax=Streptomyces sp. NPDC057474 TaxID=3346144 RepID=UPI0036D0DC91
MGANVNPVGIQWRKSSYSGDQGGQCIECAPLGPLAWRKSSHSGDQGGECVEITETPSPTIAIRDSKNPVGPQLTLDPVAFSSFLGWAASAHAA